MKQFKSGDRIIIIKEWKDQEGGPFEGQTAIFCA